MMKFNKGILIAAAMAFSAVPFASSFANGPDKSDREACIAALQPPVQRGQTLTAAQEEEVRKCMDNKAMKKEKPAPVKPSAPTQPENPPKPTSPDQTKPNTY